MIRCGKYLLLTYWAPLLPLCLVGCGIGDQAGFDQILEVAKASVTASTSAAANQPENYAKLVPVESAVSDEILKNKEWRGLTRPGFETAEVKIDDLIVAPILAYSLGSWSAIQIYLRNGDEHDWQVKVMDISWTPTERQFSLSRKRVGNVGEPAQIVAISLESVKQGSLLMDFGRTEHMTKSGQTSITSDAWAATRYMGCVTASKESLQINAELDTAILDIRRGSDDVIVTACFLSNEIRNARFMLPIVDDDGLQYFIEFFLSDTERYSH